MKKTICIIFIFAFSINGFCQGGKEVYTVKKRTHPIKIDGVIGKEEWKGATVIDKFYRSGDLDKKVHSETRVLMLYDENYLYVAGIMQDKDICGIVDTRDGPVFHDDVFEIFIKPEFHLPHYYEINTNVLGTTFDAFYPRRRAWRTACVKYTSGIESAVKINGSLNNWKDKDENWCLEARIPFTAFSETCLPAKPGDIWYFSICRYDYSVYLKAGRELTSSAKLHRRNFHLYNDYDKLIFQ
jgi:hypothetical protein